MTRVKVWFVAFLFSFSLWGMVVIIQKPLDSSLEIRKDYGTYIICDENSFEYFYHRRYRHFRFIWHYKTVLFYEGKRLSYYQRIPIRKQLIYSRYGGRGYLRPVFDYELCSNPQKYGMYSY